MKKLNEIGLKSELKSELKAESENTSFNEDLLSSEEETDVEGGFCNYVCVACTSNGVI
jgi:hypothetical protein